MHVSEPLSDILEYSGNDHWTNRAAMLRNVGYYHLAHLQKLEYYPRVFVQS